MNNSEKGKLGESYVKNYLMKEGYSVLDEKRNGCDFVAVKDGEVAMIEVKTTGNMKGGIPDMHDTEFEMNDNQWFFKVDFLYVIRINDNGIPIEMNILSKREIDEYANSHQTVTRIRTTKLDRAVYKGLVGKTINLNK
jgi:hypothetical protein